MGTKTTKVHAGMYEVSDGYRVVRVERRDDLNGWMAIADFDPHLYTDAVPTKRDAVFNAERMLEW